MFYKIQFIYSQDHIQDLVTYYRTQSHMIMKLRTIQKDEGRERLLRVF